jgi:uncharacterized protein YggE
MNTTISSLIIAAALIVSAWVIWQNLNHTTQITTNSQNSISVNADGQVSAKPDTFILQVAVEEKTKTTEEGFAAVAKKISTLQKLMKENGINDKDIQSVNISINPNYNYDNGKSTIDGFVASHGLKIKIRKLESVDVILTGVSTIAWVQIQNTSYDIDDKTEFYREARNLAITKAKQKAEDMAKATGIAVGKVISISESQSYNPPMYGNQMMKSSIVSDGGRENGSISAGQLEIWTTISINYEIR